MNATTAFFEATKSHSKKPALWFVGSPVSTFGDLKEMAGRVQTALRTARVEPGQSVFILDEWGPRFWAILLGVVSYGARVILVDPRLSRYELKQQNAMAPIRAVIAPQGAWRVRFYWRDLLWHAIHLDPGTIGGGVISQHSLEPVDEASVAVEQWRRTPRGEIVRRALTHRELLNRTHLACRAFQLDQYERPDLNWAFQDIWNNLMLGRGSVVVNEWSAARQMPALQHCPDQLRPETMTGTPFLLNRLLAIPEVEGLRAIHIGRSCADNGALARAFDCYPETQFRYFYGNMEHPLVFATDAREAVWKSEARGYFQTLSLGEPVSYAQVVCEGEKVWSGGEALPDRFYHDVEGYWYQGHLDQRQDDFILQQKLFESVRSSHGFLKRDNQSGDLTFYCERARERGSLIHLHFPEVARVAEARRRTLRRMVLKNILKPILVQL